MAAPLTQTEHRAKALAYLDDARFLPLHSAAYLALVSTAQVHATLALSAPARAAKGAPRKTSGKDSSNA